MIKELQKGGKIVFIRHSLAPGNGDPDNIDLKKCDTQRNLNQEGIEQSKKIGILFSNNNLEEFNTGQNTQGLVDEINIDS